MKIIIDTDLECVSCVDSIDMMDKSGEGYRFACERLMADLNAAVEGACAGGATEVCVLDGHAGGGNFIQGKLHPRAVEVKNMDVLEQGGFVGAFCVGYHAMAGTHLGFLDHTQASRAWFRYTINGREIGEIAQCACNAGHYGVPMLLVTGDWACCLEARRFFDPVETVSVKHAVDRNHAVCLPAPQAEESIRRGAEGAMGLVGKAKRFGFSLPAEHRLELFRTDWADIYAAREGVERVDAFTVRIVKNTNLGWGPW